MHIVFIAAGLYHHISEMTDTLYTTYKDNFHFFATDNTTPTSIQVMGHTENMCNKPYYQSIHQSEECAKNAAFWCTNADVAIIGCGNCEDFLHLRMQTGKLTFKLKERIFKKGLTKQGKDHFYEEIQRIYYRYRDEPLYYLCMGHFAAHDLHSVGVPREKLLKWGYFVYPSVETSTCCCCTDRTLKLCWVGRFIPEKRPVYALYILQHLVAHGIDASLCYIGYGKQEDLLQKTTEELDLTSKVSFLGAIPEWQVRENMRKCDWLIFSSTGWEGWGVVLSEAMSEGLTCIAAKEAGSSMELISDGVNGILFRNLQSAQESCLCLAQKGIDAWQKLGVNGKKSMQTNWSGKEATLWLVELLERYQISGDVSCFSEGLCSTAKIEPYEEYEDTIHAEE